MEFPLATASLGDLNTGDPSDPSLNLNDDPSLNLNEAMAMAAYGRGL
jgi:hypothetical protein